MKFESRKKEYCKAGIIVVALFLMAFFLSLYVVSSKTLEGTVTEIDIQPFLMDVHGDIQVLCHEYNNLSPKQAMRLQENPSDYMILEYRIELSNTSNWKKVRNIKIKPIFPRNVKGMVYAVGKESIDGMVSPLAIDTSRTVRIQKRMIVKKQKLDKELLSLINCTTFEAGGKAVLDKYEVDFIPVGYCASFFGKKTGAPVRDETLLSKL